MTSEYRAHDTSPHRFLLHYIVAMRFVSKELGLVCGTVQSSFHLAVVPLDTHIFYSLKTSYIIYISKTNLYSTYPEGIKEKKERNKHKQKKRSIPSAKSIKPPFEHIKQNVLSIVKHAKTLRLLFSYGPDLQTRWFSINTLSCLRSHQFLIIIYPAIREFENGKGPVNLKFTQSIRITFLLWLFGLTVVSLENYCFLWIRY